MNTRVLSMLLGATALMCSTLPSTEAIAKYAKLIPNGNGVAGVTALGHTDPESGGATNAFGKAFGKADHAWTADLCKADSDGDGQTNGEELGDPCCVWKSGAPQVPSGATDPGNAASKLSDDALKTARALCSPATVKPAGPATTPPTNETPALTPGTGPTPAPATTTAAPGAAAGSGAAATTTTAPPASAGTTTGSGSLSGWMTLEEYQAMLKKQQSNTASSSNSSATANKTGAASTLSTPLASSCVAVVVAVAVSAFAVAL